MRQPDLMSLYHSIATTVLVALGPIHGARVHLLGGLAPIVDRVQTDQVDRLQSKLSP